MSVCDGLAYSRQSKLDENPHQQEKKKKSRTILFDFYCTQSRDRNSFAGGLHDSNVKRCEQRCCLLFDTCELRVSVCERENKSCVLYGEHACVCVCLWERERVMYSVRWTCAFCESAVAACDLTMCMTFLWFRGWILQVCVYCVTDAFGYKVGLLSL